ncbi:MAG: ribokinase [Sphingomonas sp.]|uniref:ribokinase n=1 Tax=Sphingomonas sp. TaxID=28214 RepID=UPI0025895B9D|nr:ribokinase [Sphingomonas sp.]MCM2300979.1 ribokinase [Sphingomonas sp.]
MTASRAGGVVVVGSFNVDHVWHCDALPQPGETRAGRYHSGQGGKGFNQATASARAGATTSFVCALGSDAGGALARALAVGDGIAMLAMDSAEPTGTAGIYVDAAGRNSIVIGAGANGALDRAFIDTQADALSAAAVVLAQLESPLEAIEAALRHARAGGAVTVLNPAPANAQTSAELLALVDVLTPNETEFVALLARHAATALPADAIAGLDDQTLHRLCRALLPHGTVVVTLGAAGCFASLPGNNDSESTRWHRIAGERATVVDTTGAGDAFNGALAASMALDPGGDLPTHLRFAGRFAALSTERTGAAASMPTRADVAARFDP